MGRKDLRRRMGCAVRNYRTPGLSDSNSMRRLLVTLPVIFCSCAHTTLWDNGQKIARFEGDMKGNEFTYISKTAEITWRAVDVDHSSATLAQGKAASDKIQAVGAAAAAAGITTFLK